MLNTPYYCIDETQLLQNLKIIAEVRARSGAKSLLALKCFATWSVFDLMAQYMDGTTSSSLFEVQLGHTKFPGETHAYSVAYADAEIAQVVAASDKIIFNSINQLERFEAQTRDQVRGLRANPGVSSSEFIIADPARPFSRLGEQDPARIEPVLPLISGLMFHNNCENDCFASFDKMLTHIEQRFGHLLAQLDWVSLGGGIHFTGAGYPLDDFCQRLKTFAERWQVQVYLEPGEAAITNSTTLELTVLDIIDTGKPVAIVDSSIEAHMLDLLIYQQSAKVTPNQGQHTYMVCGKSCLAGDIFGEFHFPSPLQVGDRLSIQDAGGYTMVKKNWFNGVQMPAIVVKRLSGQEELVRSFSYSDFEQGLS